MTGQTVVIVIGSVVLVAGTVLFVFSLLHRSKLSVMAETETTPAGKAARMFNPSRDRQVEVCGLSECEAPLIAPISRIGCVYYRKKVEELHESSYRDSDGHTHTSREWRTVQDTKQHTSFSIRDSTGAVRVNPKEAKVIGMLTTGPGGVSLTSGSILTGGISMRDATGHGSFLGGHGSRRNSEWIIPVGQPTYVIGNVQRTPQGPTICKGDGQFIISSKSEEELSKGLRKSYLLFLAASLALGGGGVTAILLAALIMGKS